MKILIAPRSLDCNKGDQALMWQALEFIRSADDVCELAVMVDGPAGNDNAQVRKTRKLGVRIFPAVLPHPQRVVGKRGRKVIDYGASLWKMRFQAMLDFSGSLLLLLCPRSRLWARFLLGKDRYHTYDYLRRCRALIVKGGGFIYAHGGLYWAYFLWFSLFCLVLAQRCGIPVIVLPNSFGPFTSRWSRFWARKVLGRCMLVTTREPLSFALLDRMVPGKPLLFPDMAFELEPAASSWARSELMSLGVPLGRRPCIGVTMRPWRFPGSKDPRAKYESYLRAFASFLEYVVARGYTPVLFAHSVGPHAHEDDRIALNDVMKSSSVRDELILIDDDYDCRQAKAMYREMDYMVCTRFHSAIFSISGGVPCLAVSYQGYKARGIMGEVGLGDFVLPIEHIDARSLIAAFEKLQAEREEVKQKMRGYMVKCRSRLEELRRSVVRELRSSTEPT